MSSKYTPSSTTNEPILAKEHQHWAAKVNTNSNLNNISSTPRKISLPPIDTLFRTSMGSMEQNQQKYQQQFQHQQQQAPLSAYYSYSPQYYPAPNNLSPNTSPLNQAVLLPKSYTPSPYSAPQTMINIPTYFIPQQNIPQSLVAPSPIHRTPVKKAKSLNSSPKRASVNKTPTFEEMTSHVFVSNPNFERDIRRYKCLKCDKRFKTPGHLNRHKSTHDKLLANSGISKPGRSLKKSFA